MGDSKVAAVLSIIGGSLMAIGTFLPWISASSGFGSLSRNGLEGGDGIFILPLAIIIAVIGISRLAGYQLAGWLGKAEIIFIAIVAIVTIIDFMDVSDRASGASNDFVAASVGPGLYVIGVGVVLALWGGLAWGRGGATASGIGTTRVTIGTRECPFCKSAIRRDASVCPHCQRESPAWVLHNGKWWTKNDQGQDVYLDERAHQWVVWTA